MLNLIVSPKVISPNAEKITKRIVKYLKNENVDYSVFFLQSLDDVVKNVTELISFGETEFVVVGNDIVINSVVNAAKDLSKIKLGVIPVGDNDDFANYLNLETNPIQAIKNILNKKVESIDLLLVNNIRVVNNIIIGASVEVFEQFDQFKLKNIITEKYATITYGNKFQGIQLNLDVKNSKGKKENVFELVVANGGLCKGKEVSPLSNMTDGLFNLNYSTIMSKDANRKYLHKFNKGEHVYDAETKQYWLNNLKITNQDKKIKALIDGKVLELESLDIKIVERGLKLYK